MNIFVILNARNHLYLRTKQLFCFFETLNRGLYLTQKTAVATRKQKRDMFKVFHGCANKNNNGTNRVIEKNCICFSATSQPYWKRVRDMNFGVRTRTQEFNQKKVKLQDFNCYCRFRGPGKKQMNQ